MRVLDEALPSVKSESTKENKSLKVNYSNSKEHLNKESQRDLKGYKSSLSREKPEYPIVRPPPPSDAQRTLKKNTLKKAKSKKQLNLI